MGCHGKCESELISHVIWREGLLPGLSLLSVAEEVPESEKTRRSFGNVRRWDVQNGAESDTVSMRPEMGLPRRAVLLCRRLLYRTRTRIRFQNRSLHKRFPGVFQNRGFRILIRRTRRVAPRKKLQRPNRARLVPVAGVEAAAPPEKPERPRSAWFLGYDFSRALLLPVLHRGRRRCGRWWRRLFSTGADDEDDGGALELQREDFSVGDELVGGGRYVIGRLKDAEVEIGRWVGLRTVGIDWNGVGMVEILREGDSRTHHRPVEIVRAEIYRHWNLISFTCSSSSPSFLSYGYEESKKNLSPC